MLPSCEEVPSIPFQNIGLPSQNHEWHRRISALLIRVNAKEVTRTINLESCGKIKGSGLLPLNGSPVLETLDLSCFSIIDMDIVVPLLRAMIPFKLKLVRLGSGFLRDQPRIFTDFVRDLRNERFRQERESQLTCSACKADTLQDSRMSVPQIFGLPLSTCGSCKHHFCRRASCIVGLRDCDNCGDASCQDCAKVIRCSNCHTSSCETCEKSCSCDQCSTECCVDCFYDCGGDSCGDCDKTLCEQCVHDGQNRLIKYCEGCMTCYCGGCRDRKCLCHVS